MATSREESSREVGGPCTVAVQLGRYALGTTAWAHYFVLSFNRVILEGVTGMINHILGGFLLRLLFCPLRAVLQKATQHDGEGPYAASLRTLVLRMQVG
jgi:hypothetical protein